MADEVPDYSSTLEKVRKGHWQRTYTKTGVTADLHAGFNSLWLDLTDLQFVEGMKMQIGEKGDFLREDDNYSETQTATAKGHLDNSSLHFIEKQAGEPWAINKVDVFLRFERAWNDPPAKKMVQTGEGLNVEWKESDETRTLGECQMGSISHSYMPGGMPGYDELIALDLRVPRDFLPKVRYAAANPERVGRIRLSVQAKIFEEGVQGAFAEPWHHLDFMVEPKSYQEAYVTNLLFYSVKTLPTPIAANDEEEDRRPLAVKAADVPTHAVPSTSYGPQVVKLLTYCVWALAAIAVMLLFRR